MKVILVIKDLWESFKKTNEMKIHGEPEEENLAEIQEHGRRRQEYQPAKTKRPQVYGIKKRFVVFVVAGLAALYLFSFIFGSIKYSGTDAPKLVATSEEGESKPSSGKSSLSYDKMLQAQKEEEERKRINPLSENPNKGNKQENISPNQNVNPEYQAPPINYPGGYVAPSSGYYAPQIVDLAKIEKEEDYRKSPIGFGIVSNPAANSSTAEKTPEEQQPQTNGQAVQTNGQANINNVANSKVNYMQPQLYTLQQGAFIPVSLLTGINSDMPGQIIAQVRENVYDSVSGRYLLVPQGTKLLGEVKGGAVSTGQERIGVSWQRLIFPNGISVDLGGMAGVDTAGYAGLKDQVDNHTGKIIGATLLSSLLSAGAQIAAGNTGDTSSQSASQLAVSGAATSMMNAGTKMIEKNININPTIKIRPGIHFNVFVSRDIVLKPYR